MVSGVGGFGNVVSPAFFLWVLKQWWKIGVPAGLVLAIAVGAAVIYFFVPKYEASAILTIEDVRPAIVFEDRGRSNSQRYVQTQLELLRSSVVLEPLLSRPEIASAIELSGQPDRVSYLRRKLTVARRGGSELYNIAYISDSPKFAADLVNAVIDEYVQLQSRDESFRSLTVVALLEKERKKSEIEVERLRKHVVELTKDVTGKDAFSGTIAKIDDATTPTATLFGQLVSIDVERTVLLARLQAMDDDSAWIDPLESSGLLELRLGQHPAVLQKQSAIDLVQRQIEELKAKYARNSTKANWETDPYYLGAQRELKLLEPELAEAKLKARSAILAERKEQQKFEREVQRLKLAAEIKTLDTRREYFAKQFEDQINALKTGGGKSVELEFARNELARKDRVFELIASREIALQTESRAPTRVQLTQAARVPTVPMEQAPFKLLILACSAAFAAPFAAAVAREVTVRRINDVVQLAQESKLRVLGEITTLPVRYLAASPGKLLPNLRRAAYIFAESINSLRTNLAVTAELGGKQIVAVTSSASGEGKTSVATSLAMSIADTTGAKTLIIDGDLRSPDVATMLKTPSRPGLFEYLSDKCSLDEAIHRVGDGNLYVMPAGRATKNPHLVLKLAETKRLFDQLRDRFTSIIVDTPPILGASESLVLAKAADMAIFCSLCDVSRAKQVQLAVERLEHAGVKVAGAVLSGTPANRYASIYGYYANRADAQV